MGSIGAYMSVREEMARAFNACDGDGDGLITESEMGTLLGYLQSDVSEASAQFAASDTEKKGKVRYEQWTKVRRPL